MKRYFCVLLLFISAYVLGQAYHTHTVYKNPKDSTYNCYLAITPAKGKKIKGLLVRDYSSLPPLPLNKSNRYQWRDLALDNGLMVLYTVTSNDFPELYYQDDAPELLDDMINEVVEKYNVPKQNIFIGGISASGTRALRYVQYCEMGKSEHHIKINGVFSVDSPLDLERFYYSVHNHKSHFKDGMLWEANLMTKVFKEQFLGDPKQTPEDYLKCSVFSSSNPSQSNAQWLMNTSSIFFHEPDIEWWIKERGSSYYDINSYDIAGLYNYLNLAKHKDIELITTTGKGFDKNGKRNCHSWTIVDEDYLIQWMVNRLH